MCELVNEEMKILANLALASFGIALCVLGIVTAVYMGMTLRDLKRGSQFQEASCQILGHLKDYKSRCSKTTCKSGPS